MRQLAYFNTAPKPLGNKKQASQETRAESIIRKGGALLFPDAGDASHLLGYWSDAGRATPAGMGLTQLSWADIRAWSTMTGVEPAPWEVRVMRAMSLAYLDQMQKAADPSCPPPYGAPARTVDRVGVSNRLAGLFAALQKGKK